LESFDYAPIRGTGDGLERPLVRARRESPLD
jgi:hypothetical protein